MGLLWSAPAVGDPPRHVRACAPYASGQKMIVAERPASVSPSIRSPALVVYADSMRNPGSTAPSFACFSCAVFSKAWSARVVAATQPQATRPAGPPVVDAGAGGTCSPADRLLGRASSWAAALLPSPDRRYKRTLTTGHVHAGKTARGSPYTIQSTARVVG
jgi:hypothetical protein